MLPDMNITITADVGDDDRVLLVPKHGSDYAKVGTVADVVERPLAGRRLGGGPGTVASRHRQRRVC